MCILGFADPGGTGRTVGQGQYSRHVPRFAGRDSRQDRLAKVGLPIGLLNTLRRRADLVGFEFLKPPTAVPFCDSLICNLFPGAGRSHPISGKGCKSRTFGAF